MGRTVLEYGATLCSGVDSKHFFGAGVGKASVSWVPSQTYPFGDSLPGCPKSRSPI